MKWREFFRPVKNMNPDEVKAFIRSHKPDEFILLDVRQPKEYERAHLPGAKLIPIKELPERLNELDKDKPIITY